MTIRHENTHNETEDYDTYFVETYSGLSTKQYTIYVNYMTHEITGDVIAFGDWYDISLNECLMILAEVSKRDKLRRPYLQLMPSNDDTKEGT